METIGCYWLAIGCSLRTSRVGALVPERVRKLAGRVKGWYRLRQSPPAERKIAVAVYGFPPNVGAVGTAALLDVPKSLYMLFCRLEKEGYDFGGWPCATVDGAGSICSSETLIAALGVLSEEAVISVGANGIADRLEQRIRRAQSGDASVASSLAHGMEPAKVNARNISETDLEHLLGKYMYKKVIRSWGSDRGPGVSASNEFVVAGIEIGNVCCLCSPCSEWKVIRCDCFFKET